MADQRPPPEAPEGSPEPAEGSTGETERRREPVRGFIARWKSPPPVKRQELSSLVWIGEADEEEAEERPAEDAAPEPAAGAPGGGRSSARPEAPSLEGWRRPPQEGSLSDLEAGIASSIEERIHRATLAAGRGMVASFDQRLGRLVASVQENVTATFREELTALLVELDAVSGELRDRLARLEGMVGTGALGVQAASKEEVDGRLRALGEMVQASLGASLANLEARVTEEVSGLSARLEEVAADLPTGLAGIRAQVQAGVPQREAVEEGLSELRGRLEAMTDALPAFGRALESRFPSREDIEEIHARLAEAGHRVSELETSLMNRLPDRERMENGLARLGSWLVRLEEAIAALSIPDAEAVRRAVAEPLAESHRGLAARVEGAEAGLAEAVDALRGQVSSDIRSVARIAASAAEDGAAARREVAQAAKLVEEVAAEYGDGALERQVAEAVAASLGDLQDIAERVEPLLRPHLSTAVAQAVEDLREELRAAITGRAEVRDLADVVGVQRKFEEALTEMRSQLDAVSRVVSSFGKPRMAPRLAQEVARLERRLKAAETALSNQLASTLETRMQPLEQRVDSAIQELQARLEAMDVDGITEAVRALERQVREAIEANGRAGRHKPRFSRRR